MMGDWSYITVIDSGRDIELPEHRIYAVAYEPAWQQVRVTGSFTSVDNARRTIAALDRYLVTNLGNQEKQWRVWRVYNYMNAVPIGQPTVDGLMRIPRDAEDDIVGYRTRMRTRMEEVQRPDSWDWDITRNALRAMTSNPQQVDWLRRHHRILLRTRANKGRKQAKMELHYYLNLLLEAIP